MQEEFFWFAVKPVRARQTEDAPSPRTWKRREAVIPVERLERVPCVEKGDCLFHGGRVEQGYPFDLASLQKSLQLSKTP